MRPDPETECINMHSDVSYYYIQSISLIIAAKIETEMLLKSLALRSTSFNM
jgi:hypothetical protein